MRSLTIIRQLRLWLYWEYWSTQNWSPVRYNDNVSIKSRILLCYDGRVCMVPLIECIFFLPFDLSLWIPMYRWFPGVIIALWFTALSYALNIYDWTCIYLRVQHNTYNNNPSLWKEWHIKRIFIATQICWSTFWYSLLLQRGNKFGYGEMRFEYDFKIITVSFLFLLHFSCPLALACIYHCDNKMLHVRSRCESDGQTEVIFCSFNSVFLATSLCIHKWNAPVLGRIQHAEFVMPMPLSFATTLIWLSKLR